MNHSRSLILSVLLVALFTSACGTFNRVTTTKTTAIEQALLAQSTQAALTGIKPPVLGSRSFAIVREPWLGDQNFKGAEGIQDRLFQEQHLFDALGTWLARGGLEYHPQGGDSVDCLVMPQVHYLGVDDDDFFIGLPAIPLIIPGVGTISTPKLTLFSIMTQVGRSSFEYTVTDNKTGAVLHAQSPVFGQKTYKRWQLLFFISFRTTDLGKPF